MEVVIGVKVEIVEEHCWCQVAIPHRLNLCYEIAKLLSSLDEINLNLHENPSIEHPILFIEPFLELLDLIIDIEFLVDGHVVFIDQLVVWN